MTDDTLLPCPFCGGKDIVAEPLVVRDPTRYDNPIIVKCKNCFASTFSPAVWNRRASAPQTQPTYHDCGKATSADTIHTCSPQQTYYVPHGSVKVGGSSAEEEARYSGGGDSESHGCHGGEGATLPQPTELEMHRADYQACKDAGFESPGELLAAYKRLTETQPAQADVASLMKRADDYISGNTRSYGTNQPVGLVTALRDALSQTQSRTAGEWQPIESAPKDGTYILVAQIDREEAYMPTVVSWEPMHPDKGYAWIGVEGLRYFHSRFTHWMPLPPAPSTDTEKKS